MINKKLNDKIDRVVVERLILYFDFIGIVNNRVRFHARSKPYISTDDAMMPNNSVASKYGTAGIQNHMIFYGWMAFDACIGFLYTQGSQRNSLVNLYITADDGRLSDNDACAMINGKRTSDGCSGMDIYARTAVCIFRHQAGKKWNIQQIQLVCQPVYTYGIKAGITDYHFRYGICRRVGSLYGSRIFEQQAINRNKFIQKVIRKLSGNDLTAIATSCDKLMYRNGMPQTAENSGKPGTRLKIASRNGYQLPKYEQVVYCYSQRNYCKIQCTNGDCITASFTLKHIEQMLPYPQFIRISRSCIINTTFLEATEHKGSHYCILSYNGTKVKLRLSPEGEKMLLNMWMSL